MPKFHPTPIIQDCWSSIGNITFYHRNGQCFYKRKPYTQYRGTAAQLDQAQVHHRAILAWQQLPHSVQLQWRELAKSVPSHRPPYDDNHHISVTKVSVPCVQILMHSLRYVDDIISHSLYLCNYVQIQRAYGVVGLAGFYP